MLRKIRSFLGGVVRGYNHKKFWKRRLYLSSDGGNFIKRCYYFLWITRVEGRNNGSMGTGLRGGAQFAGVPTLPHGISGIYIAQGCHVGKGVTIFQNVTLGRSKGLCPVIGDNCVIGANAVVIGGIRIGNNVRIGAGCTVSTDIPDHMTVVSSPPQIFRRTPDYHVDTWGGDEGA